MVEFNGQVLNVLEWTNTRIRVEKPLGLPVAFGDLIIRNDTGDSNTISVTLDTVRNPAAIQNVITAGGPIGGRLLIVGHGFGHELGVVTSNGENTNEDAWCPNAILAIVPVPDDPEDVVITVQHNLGDLTFTVDLDPNASTIPNLNSVNPAVYELGTGGVELRGARFGDGVGGLVFADGVVLDPLAWSDISITIDDPAEPLDSWVVVVNNMSVSDSSPLAMLHRPAITGITPTEGTVGQNIWIFGSHFGTRETGDRVTLNGIELPVNTWADDLITATLIDGVDDGDMVVEKKLQSNAFPYNIVPPAPGPPNGTQI